MRINERSIGVINIYPFKAFFLTSPTAKGYYETKTTAPIGRFVVGA
jgi:hypothetical protein